MCRFVRCEESEIPDVRWDTPRRHQGQIVEVSYASWPRSSREADVLDPYKRVIDHSDGTVEYYRRVAS